MTEEKKEEAPKKEMSEEQKKLKKAQMEITLKQLDVNQKMVEATIDRLKADCDVCEKVEMAEESNEVKKKALGAKLAEMQAQIEGEKLKLEMIEFNRENVKKQLEEIDKMKMPPMGMPPGGGRMPPGMMGR